MNKNLKYKTHMKNSEINEYSLYLQVIKTLGVDVTKYNNVKSHKGYLGVPKKVSKNKIPVIIGIKKIKITDNVYDYQLKNYIQLPSGKYFEVFRKIGKGDDDTLYLINKKYVNKKYSKNDIKFINKFYTTNSIAKLHIK